MVEMNDGFDLEAYREVLQYEHDQALDMARAIIEDMDNPPEMVDTLLEKGVNIFAAQDALQEKGLEAKVVDARIKGKLIFNVDGDKVEIPNSHTFEFKAMNIRFTAKDGTEAGYLRPWLVPQRSIDERIQRATEE